MLFVQKKIIKIFFILFFVINKLYSLDIDFTTINLLEQNIDNGFETPINLWNINTAEDDFAPYYLSTQKEIIFNSIVNGYSKYFIAKTDSNNNFIATKLLNSPLNQSLQNRAYFALLDATHALVNSHFHYPNGNYVNIQKTKFERNSWSTPSVIAELADCNFIGHPTISPSGDVLIFATNKNSPDGTTDLWTAILQNDGTWNMLIPLDELNSIGNEITPCFVSDSMLIFASDGFDGKGGFDLYYSIFAGNKWSKPNPLEDLNTEFNESDPAVFVDGKLLFASDRTGGKGKLDLYVAKSKQIYRPMSKEEIQLSVAATNYSVEINRIINYDLIAAAVEQYVKNETDTIYKLSPQFIGFNIIADTNENKIFSNYLLKIKCNQKIVYTSKMDSNNIVIDFSKYAKDIFSNDELIIEICKIDDINTDDTTFICNTTIPIEIIKNDSKSLKKHKSANNEYYKILTRSADNIKNYLQINNDIINELRELIGYSKHIDIITNSIKLSNELKNHFKLDNSANTIESHNNSEIIELRIY